MPTTFAPGDGVLYDNQVWEVISDDGIQTMIEDDGERIIVPRELLTEYEG